MTKPPLPANASRILLAAVERIGDRWEEFIERCAGRRRVEAILQEFSLSWPEYFAALAHFAPPREATVVQLHPSRRRMATAPVVDRDVLMRQLPPGDRE